MSTPRNAPSGGPEWLFDVAKAAKAALDCSGEVINWSRAAEKLLGYPPEEVLNQPAGRLLVSFENEAKAAAAAEQGRWEDGWSGPVLVRHRNGRNLKLTLHISPMLDSTGRKSWLVVASNEHRTPLEAVCQQVFEPFLKQSPVGMAVLDTELRYVWVNDVLEYGGAVPRGRRLGRRWGELFTGTDAEVIEEGMRRVLKTGIPTIGAEFRSRVQVDPARERAGWCSVFRLDDPSGRSMGVWYMVVDVTDRWRAQQRMALLNDASARLGSSLDIARTAQELADVAVPQFADLVVVHLVESVLRAGEQVPGRIGNHPSLCVAGQRSVREGPASAARGILASLAVRCLRDGRTLVLPPGTVPSEGAVTSDPGIHEVGLRSLMVTPICARDTTLGAVAFARSRRDPFEAGDGLLAEELAARTAICLDNARRFTREHAAAVTLQRGLLPHGLTTGTALEVASRYFPSGSLSGVGGDWFDVIPLSGARTALVVGDVVGHGLHAAATMGRLRAAVRTLASLDLPPDEVLANLDDMVLGLLEDKEDALEAPVGQERPLGIAVVGATCLYAVYDPITRRCSLARAGHPPPAIVRPDGTVTFADLPAGPPLGLGAMPFEAAELEVPEGTVLALYTDGLLATCDRDVDIGLRKFADALSRATPTLDERCDNVVKALLTSPQSDDVALLLARTRVLGPNHVVSWKLPSDPAMVARARTMAAQQLAEWGLEELVFTTELIVSELVTNAIRYGSAPIGLRLIRQSALICEVSDASNTSPRLRHARTTDEGGRGLFLVAQMSHRWGTRYAAVGKIVWVEQGIPTAATADGIR